MARLKQFERKHWLVAGRGRQMRRRNLLCAKRNLRGVLCAAKERYNWLSLIMNAEIRLWLFGQHRVASLGRVELVVKNGFQRDGRTF